MDKREWLADDSRSTASICEPWPIGCSARWADDVVQEAWLRLSRADTRELGVSSESLRIWLAGPARPR